MSENESNGHIARRSKIDEMISSATPNTPRSNSWSREQQFTQSTRSPRSKSMNRPHSKELEEDDKEKRENAEAAFREWLRRKAVEPRTPRASPSREQISKHLKDEARQKVINQWHNNKRFQKVVEAYATNCQKKPDRKNLQQTI